MTATITNIQEAKKLAPTTIVVRDSTRLHRTLKALLPFASRDDSRVHMCGINIQSGNDGFMRMTATDGISLADAQTLARFEGFEGECLLTYALCKKLIAATKGKSVHEVTITLDGMSQSVQVGGDTISDIGADTRFPPVDTVVPPRDRTVDRQIVGLSPALLERAGKAIRIFGTTNNIGALFNLAGELDPVRVDYCCPDTGLLCLVLMPMRS